MADVEGPIAPKRKATPDPSPDEVAGKRARREHADDVSSSSAANGARNGIDGPDDDPVPVKEHDRQPSDLSPTRTRQNDEPPRRPSWDQRRPSAGNGPPIRRQVTLEEKKRGQRLFGSLVSTLSRSASGPGQRRAEVERRQQERAQARRAEDEKRRAERVEDIKRTREIEQINIDERAMHTRHRTILSRAKSLVTRAEPKIYYIPYRLTREQEDIINDQIREAEETIDRERREFKLRKEQRLKELGVEPPVRSPSPPPRREQKKQQQQQQQQQPDEAAENIEETKPPSTGQATVGEPKSAPQDTNPTDTVVTAPTKDPAPTTTTTTAATTATQLPAHDTKEHDGDEMVQDEEDVVIY